MAEQSCPLCLGTGIINRDGSPRESTLGPTKTYTLTTLRELSRNFKPCPACPVGEIEERLWSEWRAELAKPMREAS